MFIFYCFFVLEIVTCASGNCKMSWDCSASYSFPIIDNFTDLIYDGIHNTTHAPILPPGEWDWNHQPNAANWRNVRDNCGKFNKLMADGEHFGWHFIRNDYNQDLEVAFEYFHYSSGTEIVNLGKNGVLHSFDNMEGLVWDQDSNSGGDILAYRQSYSLNYYMGTGNNLLLVGACVYDDPLQASANSDNYYMTSTIHMNEGSDFAYVRDASQAAIDMGNKLGRTDTISTKDKNDTMIIAGNAHDIRVFGGGGSDTVFWTGIAGIKQKTTWLGLNFFGSGGYGGAIWDSDNEKVDALVLDIPKDTPLRDYGETPTTYSLLVHCSSDYQDDAPTLSDVYARYCVTCGLGPSNRKTMIFEYQTESVNTGYFYVTDFNLLQLGIAEGETKVYTIDDINCELIENAGVEPKILKSEDIPTKYCNDEIFDGAESVGDYTLPEPNLSSKQAFKFVEITFIFFLIILTI